MADKIKMTRKGYDKLVNDLEHRKTVKRSEISDYMGTAFADGDLRESAAYDEARLMQSENEAQIADLEYQLGLAEIVELGIGTAVAGLGAKVELEDRNGRKHAFEIVGTYEVDVYKGEHKKVSDQSPIGLALKDHKIGDVVKVTSPKGNLLEYTIMSVKYD